jgi:O-antigen ligase
VSIFAVALILLVSWGALALGAWPSWAAAPTLVFGVTTGLLGFLHPTQSPTEPARSIPPLGAVIVALGLFVAAIGVQLIPLSAPLVTRLTPVRNELQYERLLALADRRDPLLVPEQAPSAPRPLSIAPSRTWLGFAAVIGFGVFLVGAARGLSRVGARGITHAIVVLGVVVGFIGIYQHSARSASIYGLYVSLSPSPDSAPFINRNHQAGWLAMVLSLALGAVAGEVARGMRGVARSWRDRLLWFSSKPASVATLMMFASATTAIAILITQSRSGAVAMMASLLLVTLWNLRKQPTSVRGLAFAAALVVVMFSVISFAGQDVAARIATTSWPGMDGRVAVWQDTIRIAKTFWVTGTGFNTYGVAMLRFQTVKDGYRYIEAHNDYLQLMAEGGLLVGIPAIILVITLIATIVRRFRDGDDDTRTYWLRVGAVAGICAIAVQSVTDFTLQSPGAFVMFATLLAIAIHHPPPRIAARKIV